MLGAGGRTGVCFNGEIYGYQSLRREISGYEFQTAGDTELLLALYERDGPAMAESLPGMFAFALWDDARRRLYCARDRFGEKPFFYAWGTGGEFVFASEIKAILATGLVEPRIDPAAVRQYLRRGYVPSDRTIYRNIHSLPPAHRLVLQDGKLEIDRYWSLPPVDFTISLETAVEKFRHLFDRAVARQLVADVARGGVPERRP